MLRRAEVIVDTSVVAEGVVEAAVRVVAGEQEVTGAPWTSSDDDELAVLLERDVPTGLVTAEVGGDEAVATKAHIEAAV